MKQNNFKQKIIYFVYYLFCGILITAVSFPIFALPAVESRTGQPTVKERPDNPEFHGNNVYVGEPLIPVTAPSNPSNTPHASRGHHPIAGDSSGSVEERAAGLMLREIETLQKEVSELRGIIEVQDHEIKQLKKSQQDFYLDLDRRLSQVQNTSKAGGGKTVKPEAKDKDKVASADTKDAKKSIDQAKSKLEKQAAAKAPEMESAAIAKNEAAVKEALVKNEASAKSETLAEKPEASVPNANAKTQNNETLAYQSAYNFLKTKRYDEAVTAFQKYLTSFPQGEHVANAQYWLGEVYMVKWQADKTNTGLLDKAGNAFSQITKDHPNHTKTADAALKLALIELDKGNTTTAKERFIEVKSRYPGTTAARVAENRLRQLQ